MRGVNVIINEPAAFVFFDTVLRRWKEKLYPFDRPDAVVPQWIIPKELRANKKTLACFYFFVCIYMRGGIRSLQAFAAMIRLWQDHPELFDPFVAQWEPPAEMRKVLKKYIGWDSEAASINWVQNSRSLVANWDGDPLVLFKGLTSWEEGLRRIRNKMKKRERKASFSDGLGFRGFQPKMVSMLIYFFDWEGWLDKKFVYPTPADFHNFRLGFNQGIITLDYLIDEIRITEDISRAWRATTMKYMRLRGVDPVELSDAIWLFSLLMCGRSPLNETTAEIALNGSGMFDAKALAHKNGLRMFLLPQYRNALAQTCLRCPIAQTCTLAIPAGPYYGRRMKGLVGGWFILNDRPRVEDHLGRLDPDLPSQGKITVPTLQNIALWE